MYLMIQEHTVPILQATVGVDDPAHTETDGTYQSILCKRLLKIDECIEVLLQNTGRFAEGDIIRFSAAFQEAAKNAIYHGNLERESKIRESDDPAAEANDLKRRTVEFHDRVVSVEAMLHYRNSIAEPELTDRTLTLAVTETKSSADHPAKVIDNLQLSVATELSHLSEIIGLSIVIRDEGKGFDPSLLHDATTPEGIQTVHGRGIQGYMMPFTHRLQFNKKGNEVSMFRYARLPNEDTSDW